MFVPTSSRGGGWLWRYVGTPSYLRSWGYLTFDFADCSNSYNRSTSVTMSGRVEKDMNALEETREHPRTERM